MEHQEFASGMPTMAHTVFEPGELAIDEGIYVCVTCNSPGNEASLLPGEELPQCVKCGSEARWVKV